MVVRTLIKKGANVNAEDEKKETPLHRAASKGISLNASS